MRITSGISSSLLRKTHELYLFYPNDRQPTMPNGFNRYDVTPRVQVSIVSILTFLAFRAKVRGPLRHQHAANRSSTGHTRLACALVDTMAELEESLASFRIYIIGYRRAAGGNGFREYGDHGVEQLPRALSPETGGDCQRMDTGAKKGFIGINISDAA